MKLTRKNLMEAAGLREVDEISTVLYVAGNSGDDVYAIKNAIKQGTFAEVEGDADTVAEDVETQAVEYPEMDLEWPGIDKSEIKQFFQKHMKTLQKGDEVAGDSGYEGWMNPIEKSKAVDALVVPIGYVFPNDDGFEEPTPVMVALVYSGTKIPM